MIFLSVERSTKHLIYATQHMLKPAFSIVSCNDDKENLKYVALRHRNKIMLYKHAESALLFLPLSKLI